MSNWGLRILWSSGETDGEKLAKAQAVEHLDAIFCGTHWSNHPVFSADICKAFDVLFSWE